jgi:hypothetical protein
MMYSNPTGSETMATMGASDKIVWPLLGGLESRLASAMPVNPFAF